jgi:hypothetical protein
VNRSDRRRQTPLMSQCTKHVHSIGSQRANTHHGPVSEDANERGRIYESSRTSIINIILLATEEESIYETVSSISILAPCRTSQSAPRSHEGLYRVSKKR